MRSTTPWVWVNCEKCPHHAPLACDVLVIRWGAQTRQPFWQFPRLYGALMGAGSHAPDVLGCVSHSLELLSGGSSLSLESQAQLARGRCGTYTQNTSLSRAQMGSVRAGIEFARGWVRCRGR